MKIILLKDVPGVGAKYDIKEVSSGFAHNFIIAKKLGKPATEKDVEDIGRRRLRFSTEKNVRKDLLIKNIKDVEGAEIMLEEKANDKGHLFAKVHKDKLATAIKEQLHLGIPEELILEEEPIKETGIHTILIGTEDARAKLTLKIISEK